MKGIIVGWGNEGNEPFTNAVVRQALLNAAAMFREEGIEEFFPSTVFCQTSDLVREAEAVALSFPDNESPPENPDSRAAELLCLLDRVLFNLISRGPRSHDPMFLKYFGGRLRRYWRITLKLSGQTAGTLWLPFADASSEKRIGDR